MAGKTSGRFSRYPAVNRDGGAAPVAKQVAKPAAKPVAAPVDNPVDNSVALSDMTVAEVLAWVGDDDARRADALAAEQSGKQRKSLLDALSD